MTRGRKQKVENETPSEPRKLKVPATRIKKIVKLNKALREEIKNVMNEYNVSSGYIRGILKEPTQSRSSK